MAMLQECLWFIMEPFLIKKETTDFEFIYRLLQDIKASSDALYEKKHKDEEISQAQVMGQNKKMWALADLGMLMLVYRGKVAIRNEPRKPLLSSRFFLRDKCTEHAATVYAPEELIEDEKRRNGKVPTDEKRRLNMTTKGRFTARTGTKNAVNIKKCHPAAEKEMDPEDICTSPKHPIKLEAPQVPKRANRKPLKIEQASITDLGEVKDRESINALNPFGFVSILLVCTTTRSSLKRQKTKDNQVSTIENGAAVLPSTSKEQLPQRSLRSHSTHQLSFRKTTLDKQSLLHSENEGSSCSQSKENEKNSSRSQLSLEKLHEYVDLSPITRSTSKAFPKDRSRRKPLLTSTPLHTAVSNSPKSKTGGKKNGQARVPRTSQKSNATKVPKNVAGSKIASKARKLSTHTKTATKTRSKAQ
ncbi:hypothetical protein DICVIV_07126 [Dictyocaulus viviparus]|uniref:Uncharacterized protein n=1 Tax=Dictyocaulus viviparus TaxID=29172 RepID=A0A0D8XQK7_DICVI|nr:hypothetical protein DICVIV_07126 [Dictyocaulus viviparus]